MKKLESARGAFSFKTAIAFCLTCVALSIAVHVDAAYAVVAEDAGFLVPIEQKIDVPEGYIGIYTAEDFDDVRNDLGSNYILMNDIDLSGYADWEPIGRFDSDFTGDFDGNGYKITSFNSVADGTIQSDTSLYACLFRSTRGNTISNLDITGSAQAVNCIDGIYYCYVSGIAGEANRTHFENCVSRVAMGSNDTDVALWIGGVAADASACSFENCANYGSITVLEHASDSYVDCSNITAGGIVGRSTGVTRTSETIADCLNRGSVSVTCGSCALCGGIVGDHTTGIIARCSSEADVEISSNSTKDYGHHIGAGGLAGEVSGTISQCYAIGDISAGYGANSVCAGGIAASLSGVGVNSGEELSDCYFVGDVTALSVTDGGLSSFGGAGGIVGGYSAELDSIEGGKIVRCYSIGNATARSTPSPTIPDTDFSYAGGIVASDGSLEGVNHDFVSCYYSSSGSYSAHHVNDNSSGTPLSPAAMSVSSSYDGWDFRTVWQMGNGDYPYPTLRALPGVQPSDDPRYEASDPLTQLVACELATFNPGPSWVGKTVEDFVASAPFQAKDKAIWRGRDEKYSDLFSSVIKSYEFVSASGEGPKKHVALRDPISGNIVLALDPYGIITYASVFASLPQSEGKGCFDGALEICQEARTANPDTPIYVTGSFLGGMAAAYVSNTSGSPANVFNASAGYGAKLSWLTQGEFVDGNGFEGIDRPLCKNYYASSMSFLFGYGSDVVSSAKVDANPNGSQYRLNSLYEMTESGFALRTVAESSPEAAAKTFYIADTEAVLESITKSVNNLNNGKPDLSFASKSTQLTLGTSGTDTRLTGIDGALGPYDMFLPQIIYTGSGAGDLMRGGQTADIFVAGSGSSRFIGNEGSDLYVIGGNADVRISDTCATDGNVLCKGLMGVMKTIVFTNLVQPDKAKDGVEDILESMVDILMDSRQDTIVFRSCSFDDMQITLVDAPFPNSDYYEIKADTSTVQVQKRFFLKRDFLLVDASASGENARKAEGKNLEDLYREKSGALGVQAIDSFEGDFAVDATTAVTLHLEGTNVEASVRDRSTGIELYSFGLDEDIDYCDEYGTFTSSAESHCFDAVYDASKVEVALVGGVTTRIMTNSEAGDVEAGIDYVDWVTPSEFEEVRIKTGDGVDLVGISSGYETPIETKSITVGDIDTSISAEARDISEATVSQIPDQEWLGAPVIPDVVVAYEGVSLENGVDYDLSYEGNASVGSAAAVISGKGLFTGEQRVYFTIYAPKPEPQPEPDQRPQPQSATADRFGGSNRYETMALVSQQAFPKAGSCKTVIVARGDNFPDALAAAGLAGTEGGQVLLTATSALTPETKAEIKRLGATKAYVLGDKYSVSDRAFNEIKSLVGGNATRIGGSDRIDTALRIYKAGSGWGGTAIVTTGAKAADALSASPIAYRLKAPIFLADGNGNLSKSTIEAISKGGFDTVLIMGSTYSVSGSAEKSLEKHAATVRFSGSTRYETSQFVAEWVLANGFTCKNAVATAGREGKYADALVASSLCGSKSSPLLLVDDGIGGDLCVSNVLAPNRQQAEKIYVLGDTNSVSGSMHASIKRALA